MSRNVVSALTLIFATALAAGCSSKPPADAGRPAEPTPKADVKPGEAARVEVPPAAGPDLQVIDVYLKDGYMRARIKNGGTERAAGVRAAFFVDGKSESVFGAITLKPGQEHEAGASKLPSGMHVVRVVVDPENKVRETDETNNAKEATLTAPSP